MAHAIQITLMAQSGKNLAPAGASGLPSSVTLTIKHERILDTYNNLDQRFWKLEQSVTIESKSIRMIGRQHYWRLLSESFDRELSIEEQNFLAHFMAESKSPREFEEFFKRIRDCAINHELTPAAIALPLNHCLGEKKKNEIQRLLDSATVIQQDSLSNRDVVFACELVSQGATSLGDLTERISQWDSDSTSLKGFLKSRSTADDIDFSKIESHVSETIFAQTLDQTVLNEVVTAIKQRAPKDVCTVFENTTDHFASSDFVNLLDKANAGQSDAFESLLDWLTKESRSVILQTRMFSHTLRLKPVVDEVTLRLVGRNKLNRDQLSCYYRNVGIAIRKLFHSDPKLSLGLLRSPENRPYSVAQIVNSLSQLAVEEPKIAQMFNLRFFAGLTAQQVASLFELSDQEVAAECDYGTARLLQLLTSKIA